MMLIRRLVVILLVSYCRAEDGEFDYADRGTRGSYKIGRFQIFNKSYSELLIIKVSHLVGNNHSDGHGTDIFHVRIAPFSVSNVYEFDYQNGLLAGFDYWFVSVRVDNEELETKSNFFCNITNEDNGVVVLIVDASGRKVEVVPSSSSSCWTRLS